MQIFVNKADLINPTVTVQAYYPDSTPPLSITLHGANATLLALPPADIDLSQLPPVLVSTFRNDMAIMVNAEATRRILLVFSEQMQRNSNADINRSTTLYGASPAAWPADAQARKTEGDRGWNYVGAVRQASDALSTQTSLNDPTDDSHWPTAISPPVYIEPTP
jgi:hypothetical protein